MVAVSFHAKILTMSPSSAVLLSGRALVRRVGVLPRRFLASVLPCVALVTGTSPAATFGQTPPVISTAPHNGDNRVVGMCVAACFDALVTYTTPAYISMDIPRTATLAYRAAHAKPMPVVQVDVTDNSGSPPDKLSIRLKRPNGTYVTFTNGTTELFFQGASGTSRLSAQFDGSALVTGPYTYTVEIRAYRGGSSLLSTASVRVLLINEINSPFGAGWSLAETQKFVADGNNLMIVSGDGSAAYFSRNSCNPMATTCTFTSPVGDFSLVTMTRLFDEFGPTDSIFYRRYPDGFRAMFWDTGALASLQDRFGNSTSFTSTTITDPAGKEITLSFGADGKLDWIRDAGNRYTYITIDGSSNLTEITDAAGIAALRLVYDAQHRITRRTDRRGSAWAFAYDFAGKLQADSTPVVIADGVSGPLVSLFVSSESRILIDPASGLGTFASPAPRVVSDSVWASVTNPRGFTTRYRVDRWGAPTRIDEPLGRITIITRNASGQVTQTVTPAADTIDQTWTGPNLTQVRRRSDNKTVNMTYESTYNQLTSLSGDAEPVTYYWSNGRLDSVRVGSSWNVTKFRYDSRGRDTLVTDPSLHQTRKYYAASGWQNTDSVKVATRKSVFFYDGFGRDTASKDPRGKVFRKQFDGINRLTRIIGPIQDTTLFVFDSLFLRAVVDAKGQWSTFVRNALGWVTSDTGAAGPAARSFTFDRNGNLLSATNRRGQTVTFAYDSLDQLRTRVAGADTARYFTDPLGLLAAASNAVSSDTTKFDKAGRVTNQIMVRGGTRYELVAEHNARDLRSLLRIGSPISWADTIRYTYNERLQLESLVGLASDTTRLKYNSEFLLDTIVLPTGLKTWRRYPSTHSASRIHYSDATIDHKIGRTYAFGDNGELKERSRAAADSGRDFGYDDLTRLTSYKDFSMAQPVCWDEPNIGRDCDEAQKQYGPVTTYTYDKVGNRTDLGAIVAPGNRLVKLNGDSLVYDTDGNLTKRVRASQEMQRFHWNSLGQLVAAWTSGSDSVTFAYDALGRRVRKWTASGAKEFVHDGDDLLFELDGGGSKVAEYTFFPGVDQPIGVRRGTDSYYFLTDYTGHVVGLVSSTNSLVNEYRYAPFGQAELTVETVPNTLRFGARERDVESGLDFNRARYYDPTLGRFISEDPIGLGAGTNTYTYVNNAPMDATDPAGLCMSPASTRPLPDGHPRCNHGAGAGGIPMGFGSGGPADWLVLSAWARVPSIGPHGGILYTGASALRALRIAGGCQNFGAIMCGMLWAEIETLQKYSKDLDSEGVCRAYGNDAAKRMNANPRAGRGGIRAHYGYLDIDQDGNQDVAGYVGEFDRIYLSDVAFQTGLLRWHLVHEEAHAFGADQASAQAEALHCSF
jgi:RHS repeat-associated protein